MNPIEEVFQKLSFVQEIF